jgi:uncharacterized membrane protein
MNEANDKTLFAAVLTPNEPLTPSGFAVVMGLLVGVSFIAGAVFMAVGAWPVTGFLGLDILLVWFAFRASFASSRRREEVAVTASEFVLRRILPGRAPEVVRLPRFGSRIELENEEAEVAGRLYLRRGRERVEFGSFLSEPDRRSLATALARALVTAR